MQLEVEVTRVVSMRLDNDIPRSLSNDVFCDKVKDK